MPPSSHSWAVRDGSGLPPAVQVFCRPSVTSWLPRAVASSGHCHQHHSCLGTASVPALSPHHVWDAGRASASHCLRGTQLFSSFTTIIAVLCCLLPRCGLFALMVHYSKPHAHPLGNTLDVAVEVGCFQCVNSQQWLWRKGAQSPARTSCGHSVCCLPAGCGLPKRAEPSRCFPAVGVRGPAQSRSGCKVCNTLQWCPSDYSALAESYWPKLKKPLGTCCCQIQHLQG